MEIQKIFSDYNDEERYYSVLMTEEELDFIQREFNLKATFNNVRKNGIVGQIKRNQAASALKISRNLSNESAQLAKDVLKASNKDAMISRNKTHARLVRDVRHRFGLEQPKSIPVLPQGKYMKNW